MDVVDYRNKTNVWNINRMTTRLSIDESLGYIANLIVYYHYSRISWMMKHLFFAIDAPIEKIRFHSYCVPQLKWSNRVMETIAWVERQRPCCKPELAHAQISVTFDAFTNLYTNIANVQYIKKAIQRKSVNHMHIIPRTTTKSNNSYGFFRL